MNKKPSPLTGLVIAVVFSLLFWVVIFNLAFGQEIEDAPPPPPLVLEYDVRFVDVDQEHIERPVPQEPDIRSRVDLGGFEDFIDMGDEWSNDCKVNPNENELLVCRLSW